MSTGTGNREAIKVTTSTEIDWWELGRMVANEADSDEQAVFLHGLAVGFNTLPSGRGGMQVAYIRDSIFDLGTQYADEVRGLLEDLTLGEAAA